MSSELRSLVPSLAVAFVLAAILIPWIRFHPLAMPRAAQVTLSIALVIAVGGLIVLVRWATRQHPAD